MNVYSGIYLRLYEKYLSRASHQKNPTDLHLSCLLRKTKYSGVSAEEHSTEVSRTRSARSCIRYRKVYLPGVGQTPQFHPRCQPLPHLLPRTRGCFQQQPLSSGMVMCFRRMASVLWSSRKTLSVMALSFPPSNPNGGASGSMSHKRCMRAGFSLLSTQIGNQCG